MSKDRSFGCLLVCGCLRIEREKSVTSHLPGTSPWGASHKWGLTLIVLPFLSLFSSSALVSSEPAPGMEFFEERVRPVLVNHCYRCHSSELQEPAGGLRLDTSEGIRRGGHSGSGVVPGDPVESLVLKALRYEGLEMPPDEKLSPEIIADFRQWIAMGAPDSRIPEDDSEVKSAGLPESAVVCSPDVLFRRMDLVALSSPIQSWPNRVAGMLLSCEKL